MLNLRKSERKDIRNVRRKAIDNYCEKLTKIIRTISSSMAVDYLQYLDVTGIKQVLY